LIFIPIDEKHLKKSNLGTPEFTQYNPIR